MSHVNIRSAIATLLGLNWQEWDYPALGDVFFKKIGGLGKNEFNGTKLFPQNWGNRIKSNGSCEK